MNVISPSCNFTPTKSLGRGVTSSQLPESPTLSRPSFPRSLDSLAAGEHHERAATAWGRGPWLQKANPPGGRAQIAQGCRSCSNVEISRTHAGVHHAHGEGFLQPSPKRSPPTSSMTSREVNLPRDPRLGRYFQRLTLSILAASINSRQKEKQSNPPQSSTRRSKARTGQIFMKVDSRRTDYVPREGERKTRAHFCAPKEGNPAEDRSRQQQPRNFAEQKNSGMLIHHRGESTHRGTGLANTAT